MVGVSPDTLISWENGRNKLPPEKARLIHMATGARPAEMVVGKGKVLNMSGQPYSAADFDLWQRTYLNAPDEKKAEYFHKQASIAIWLLFMAAAKPGAAKLKNRLPGVWGSFLQWAEEVPKTFKLKPQMDEVKQKNEQWLKKRAAQAHAVLGCKQFGSPRKLPSVSPVPSGLPRRAEQSSRSST